MPQSKRSQPTKPPLAVTSVATAKNAEALAPTVEVIADPDRIQAFAAKLRAGKSFLHLVLINVASGINQHRMRQLRADTAHPADVVSLYNEAEELGVFKKRSLAVLEKLFKSIIKADAFWEKSAHWILTRLDQWEADGRTPADCSIPGLFSVDLDPTLPEDQAWRESVTISACAFHTASEWLNHLDLSTFSIDEIDKLLGLQSAAPFASDPLLFQNQEIEKVATGYPILTGAQALINGQWEDDEENYPYWRKLVGEGFIQHNIVRPSPSSQQIELVPGKAAWEIIQQFGPEAAYVLLIFSAYATDADEPWKQQIRLRGSDLVKLFGWDRRTDISLGQKLKKIGNLVELVCSLSVLISNINVGANRYNVARGSMWLLEELEYSGQLGLKMEAGRAGSLRYEAGDPDELYIKIRPGSWTEKFLNAKNLNGRDALCQYGYLAKSTLQINPYRQRLASKLAIFLTIMSRIRQDGRYEVRTLLERLEPRDLLEAIQSSRQRRNALINQWDSALLTLHELGWQVEFDAETYPPCIRPAWSLEDEAEQLKNRPRNWLSLWLKAIVVIRPTVLIQEKLGAVRSPDAKAKSDAAGLLAAQDQRTKPLSGDDISVALEAKGWSKSQLAKSLGVDRSLVTRWVKGERTIQPKHQVQIKALLSI